MPEPSKIPAAWAWDGDINTIPATDPGNGLASWERGYPIETQTPIAAGGTPPRRQDMNGVLNWLSLYSLWGQQGGLWQYDATENYEIGNVIEENNALYYCIAANGPVSTVKSPSADTAGAYWKLIIKSDGTLNVPTVGNATTSARGIVELATSAETKALTDSQRAITPSSLNGLLSLSPVALMVPKADSNGKLTGWLDALKNSAGKVAISITGTAPTLETARTVRVNLASTSAASFNGSANITPGVSGVLNAANGGTGQNNLDAVTVGKAKQLNTARNINGTSFNGTANITTAQWGTARSAKIKDASKAHTGAAVSVNGSGDFSLLLPSTITAALIGNVTGDVSGNAGTATKLKTARTINGTSFDGTANITAMESSSRSLAQNGYIKFQSGLIVQWGVATAGSNKEATVALPIAFTSNIYVVLASDENTSQNVTYNASAFEWYRAKSSLSTLFFTTNSEYALSFCWLAIGK